MPSLDFVASTDIKRSARVLQVEGMFDVPPSQRSEVSWQANLPIEDREWNIGLVVGPSGSGKSTVARQLWADRIREFSWDPARSLLDDFPAAMSIKDVVALLSSVGFSSPPSWLRPFAVLSTGEQFRTTLARTLAEADGLCVVDEFTSVIDRTVAKIGSAALAKTVRQRNQQFIAVTCHEDVEDWLQPDWTFRPGLNEFSWRLVQRRPTVTLEIFRVHHEAWRLFKQHHYLDAGINKSAWCFLAQINGRPAAFSAWLNHFGKTKRPMRKEHRTVCLPDFQGVGVGNALSVHVASMWSALGWDATSTTSHPAMIRSRNASPLWKMIRSPQRTVDKNKKEAREMRRASGRLSAGFRYVGPAMDLDEAKRLLAG
jgi:ABC-type lipoprotein export system ATPase subunit